MVRSSSPVPALWRIARQELQAAKCPYRLRLIRSYEWIRVRETRGGQVVRDFKLDGLRWSSEDDIRAARDLCLTAHQRGAWPDSRHGEALQNALSWPEVGERLVTHLQRHFNKVGSASGYLGDARHRIPSLQGPVQASVLRDWVLAMPLPDRASTYRQRIFTLHHINLCIDDLDLENVIASLRLNYKKKMTGAAAKASRVRNDDIRVIPTDDEMEAYLDILTGQYNGLPFDQLFFAYMTTYGLRPHELWHMESIDDDGWVKIPGGPEPDADGHVFRTKTGTHFAPPVPSAWVERYRLKENFSHFLSVLRERWTIRWVPVVREDAGGVRRETGFTMPANNHLLGHYANKQFTRGAVPRLIARKARGDEQAAALPYDFRHSYAIRCALHPETQAIPMEFHANWMGHGLELHEKVYLRWINQERKKAGMKQRLKAFKPETDGKSAPPRKSWDVNASDDPLITAQLSAVSVENVSSERIQELLEDCLQKDRQIAELTKQLSKLSKQLTALIAVEES